MADSINSVLRLDNLFFDKIVFNRLGPSSEAEVKFSMRSNIMKSQNEEVYKVTLSITGDKANEYNFEISVSGIFSFVCESKDLDFKLKEALISKNTIAILMPYLRSEVSLLTAQPGMSCIVLPPFNVNNMVDNGKDN